MSHTNGSQFEGRRYSMVVIYSGSDRDYDSWSKNTWQVVTRRESNVKSERVSAVSKNAMYRQCIVTYYWLIEYQPNQGIFGGFDSMLSLNAFMMSKRGSLSKFDKRERFDLRQCTAVCFCFVRNKGVNTSPVLTYCVCYLLTQKILRHKVTLLVANAP